MQKVVSFVEEAYTPTVLSEQIKILVIDDEKNIADLVTKFLQNPKYDIKTVYDGREALKYTEGEGQGKIDILITDYLIPGTNGIVMNDQIAKTSPDLKTIVISGYYFDEDEHVNLKEKDISFLPKPFTRDQLLSTIEKLL